VTLLHYTLLACFLASSILINSSVWLRGRWAYIATIATWTLSMFFFAVLVGMNPAVLALLLLIFLGIFYAVTVKYLTRTRWLDTSYFAEGQFAEFLKKKGRLSPYQRFLIALPWLLFIFLVLAFAFQLITSYRNAPGS
jgi:hypothetical protein